MVALDDHFLPDEDLDNIDTDNEGDDGADESSSGNEEIAKWSPCDCKILLFACYLNQYMTTTKTKIQCNKNRSNST